MKPFFSIWLFILVINQLLIFSACFAPYCLLAALPHTLIIALLINFFFKKDKSASHPGHAPGKSSKKTVSHVKTTSEFLHQKNFEKAPTRAGRVFLQALILITAIGLSLLAVFGSLWKSGSASIATSGMLGDEVSNEVEAQGRALSEEPFSGDKAHRSRPVQDLSRHIDQDDDEFDVNDIETYERLTKRKNRVPTQYNNDEQYVVEDASLNSGGFTKNTKTAKPSKIGNKHEESASMPNAYQCTNAAGKVGKGTGRISQANEYSSFLQREVHEDEFVIFRYQGSEKEYWFKVSNCIQL